MRRCRHTTEMPVNFVFFVPQAMMKGLMKLGRWVSSIRSDFMSLVLCIRLGRGGDVG